MISDLSSILCMKIGLLSGKEFLIDHADWTRGVDLSRIFEQGYCGDDDKHLFLDDHDASQLTSRIQHFVQHRSFVDPAWLFPQWFDVVDRLVLDEKYVFINKSTNLFLCIVAILDHGGIHQETSNHPLLYVRKLLDLLRMAGSVVSIATAAAILEECTLHRPESQVVAMLTVGEILCESHWLIQDACDIKLFVNYVASVIRSSCDCSRPILYYDTGDRKYPSVASCLSIVASVLHNEHGIEV